MPFKSQKQRSFMYAQHPSVAKKWTDEYPEQTQLPEEADPEGQEQDAMDLATDPIKAKRNRRMGRLKKVIEGPAPAPSSGAFPGKFRK